MSNPTMEDALCEIASMHLFAGLSLDSLIPNHATICMFKNKSFTS
ncbi:transposase [Marinomonas rhizomae]|nr:transposase [Marinomonas rhizomae]